MITKANLTKVLNWIARENAIIIAAEIDAGPKDAPGLRIYFENLHEKHPAILKTLAVLAKEYSITILSKNFTSEPTQGAYEVVDLADLKISVPTSSANRLLNKINQIIKNPMDSPASPIKKIYTPPSQRRMGSNSY